ncbi:MAG: LemA family protein [Acidimicrobiales bacterium]
MNRPKWLLPVGIVVGVLVLLIGPLVGIYNSLVTAETKVEQSFADLDSQLQRRYDLIPQLVGAVRGILGQEQAVFGELARARASYSGARTPSEKAEAADQIESGFGRLLAIFENFPQLRSADNVRDLQTQIESTENRIVQARRDYNASVGDYNISVRRFPRSILAGLFGFERKELFEAAEGAETAPTVDLGVTPGGTQP